MARRLLFLLTLLLAMSPVPAAQADPDPFADIPPDVTSLPIVDELITPGVVAHSVLLTVPPGSSVELAMVGIHPADSTDLMFINTDLRNVGDPNDWAIGVFQGGQDTAMAHLTVDGHSVVSHTERTILSSDVIYVAVSMVLDDMVGGTYRVNTWLADTGPVAWSRLRIRAPAGTSVLNTTTTPETFLTNCRDFEGGTHVAAGGWQVSGATASLDRSHVVSVDDGLVGVFIVNGTPATSGSALGVDLSSHTAGYQAPDGSYHPVDVFGFLSSPLAGDYTFSVDRAVSRGYDCGYVTGADLTPA